MTAPCPLVLPELSRAEADRSNRIARWRAPLPLAGNEAYSLHRLDREPVPAPASLLVGFVVGGDRLRATMPRALLLDLVRSLDSHLSLTPLPPPDLLALLLEASLLPLLDAFERGGDRSIRLQEVAVPPGGADGAGGAEAVGVLDRVPVGLRGPGLRQDLVVEAAVGAVDRLLSAWPAGKRPLDALPIPAVLLAGSTILSVRLLRSLRVGDAVLLQHQPAILSPAGAPAVLQLVAAEVLNTPVRAVGARWHLDARLQAMTRLGTVSDDEAPDGGGADLDAIPVRLVFEAGRIELSLGALRGLGAGSVLDVDAVPGTVRILVGGRCIGEGELVNVEGRAGVRITAFAPGLDGVPEP